MTGNWFPIKTPYLHADFHLFSAQLISCRELFVILKLCNLVLECFKDRPVHDMTTELYIRSNIFVGIYHLSYFLIKKYIWYCTWTLKNTCQSFPMTSSLSRIKAGLKDRCQIMANLADWLVASYVVWKLIGCWKII